MEVRWSFHMSRFGAHPAKSERIEIREDGIGSYEIDAGEGVLRCSKRVSPALHRKAVEAARAVIAGGGCSKAPPKREMPTTSIEVGYDGTISDTYDSHGVSAGVKIRF